MIKPVIWRGEGVMGRDARAGRSRVVGAPCLQQTTHRVFRAPVAAFAQFPGEPIGVPQPSCYR
ncbi:hypothetical protein ACFPM0_36735 [Pseudonocardia sulfidoxydans]|uniref:hypothetical protein n=1 Tax=Pseudonocardia sulfidoxydans TaxID=54011 RepID=UPI00361563BD